MTNKKRDTKLIIDLVNGKSPADVAKKYGISRARVYQIAKNKGLTFPRGVETLRDRINGVVNDALTMNITQLAYKYDVSYTVMYKFLTEQGIEPARVWGKRFGTYGVKGKRFHSWTVIDDTRHAHEGVRTVLALCGCGKEKVVSLRNLESGLSKSCRSCSAKNWHKKKVSQ